MNDLFISIAKERLLPVSLEIIDYPHEYTESQLYKISVYITQNIMNLYIIVNSWSIKDMSEDIKLDIVFEILFPKQWLVIAETSPQFHLKLLKVIQRYQTNMSENGIKRIHRIVEFFCYELIETMVITSGFIKMFDITPYYITKAVESDPILKKILKNNNIYIVENIPNFNMIDTGVTDMSNKCHKLLRIYVEKLLQNIFDKYKDKKHHTLTIENIREFFNI